MQGQAGNEMALHRLQVGAYCKTSCITELEGGEGVTHADQAMARHSFAYLWYVSKHNRQYKVMSGVRIPILSYCILPT